MIRKIISFIFAGSLKKNRNAMAGGFIVLLFVLTALLAPLISPFSHEERPARGLQPLSPSPEYLLGTDKIGRDVFSRIMYGSRISLRIGLVSVGIALAAGTFLGVLAGYTGGWWDMGVMRIMDALMAFPAILLAIIIVTILGGGLTNLMIAVGLVAIPQYARLVRGQVLKVKTHEYVTAAIAGGLPHRRIILKHILPNCLPVLIVQSTFSMATAILDAAGLSFLGLGPEPSQPEWGVMMSDGIELFIVAPWVIGFTGLAILLLVIGFNLLGDGLRDVMDPRIIKKQK